MFELAHIIGTFKRGGGGGGGGGGGVVWGNFAATGVFVAHDLVIQLLVCTLWKWFLLTSPILSRTHFRVHSTVSPGRNLLVPSWFQLKALNTEGAGCSSEVERSLMVRWVVGSILHGVDPLSYFSFQPVLHDWCNKGRGMCYPVCGMVHIKEPLLLIDKSSLCGGSGFPFSLSEWSLTICLTPCNRR